MYEIDITYFLYLALVIPLLVIVNYIYMLWRKKVQNSFSKHDLLEYISPNRSNFKLNLKAYFRMFSHFMFIHSTC